MSMDGGKGLTFRLDQEAKALIAIVTPDPEAKIIDEAWLQAYIAESGYGEFRFLPGATTIILANYNSSQAVEVKIADCVDAVVALTISPDGVEALLDIQAAAGGTPTTREATLALLAEHGIGEGVIPEAIDAAVAAGAVTAYVVARGIPPQHGLDGYFESLIPEVRDRSPREDETGHTNYRDLGDIFVVHPGDDLMRRHLPTVGKPGKTLFGETIEAIPGKAVQYSGKMPGTMLAPGKVDLLQAAITGQPVVILDGMMVEPVFQVDAVDTASGNIDFEGSVVVKGDVSAGMTVRATGDIEVGGVVELATLEAGGGIVVKGGVIGAIGRQTSGECHVRSAGNVNAGYIQQAAIEAGDSIFVDDTAMQCELSAINHIFVGNKRRGYIIGGRVQATLSITAKVIGAHNRVKTLCEIGVNPLMHKQLLDMCKKRDERENQLLEVSKLIQLAAKTPGKLPPAMIENARATAAALSQEIATMRGEQDALTQKILLSQEARVNVLQALFEGTEVHMGNLCYRAVGVRGPCAIGQVTAGLDLLELESAS